MASLSEKTNHTNGQLKSHPGKLATTGISGRDLYSALEPVGWEFGLSSEEENDNL